MALPDHPKAAVAGILCGAGAALFWAVGFVAARHGIDVGFTPADLAIHRFVWAGLILLPLLARDGLGDLGGIGWGKSIALTVLSGPGQAIISLSGFLWVPLAHGGLIQPSAATLGGLLLAAFVLKERLPAARVIGALLIVSGLVVIGGEALATFGTQGLFGDFMFAMAGTFFAIFGMLLRHWRIAPTQAMAAVSVLSLAGVPIHWALTGFERMIALGLWENLLQALAQGILAGPAAIYLFTHAVILLGAGRAAVFPALVPGFTLLTGFLLLGTVPSLMQLLGFAIVMIGFHYTQKQ